MKFTEAEAKELIENCRRNRKGSSPEPAKPLPPPVDPGMNKTEARYAAHLDELLSLGTILKYDFEKITFRLAPKTTYTPDFMIIHPDYIEFVEIKGFLQDDAGVKYKVAREMFPEFKWSMLSWDSKKREWKSRLPLKA